MSDYRRIKDITDEGSHLDITFEDYNVALGFLKLALNLEPSHIYLNIPTMDRACSHLTIMVSVDKKTFEKLTDGLHLKMR